MKRWLVTGGCGFIGSHLVDALLARGDTVRILDDLSTGKRHDVLAGAELRVGDVADRDEVARALTGVDGCFHLAAVASVERCTQDWLGSHRTNLTGTVTVFDAARSAGPSPLPVVYASSAAVYGDNPHVPLSETATTRPLSAYGADKLACEFHAQVAWGVHRVPNLGLRFFNVYGPRQDTEFALFRCHLDLFRPPRRGAAHRHSWRRRADTRLRLCQRRGLPSRGGDGGAARRRGPVQRLHRPRRIDSRLGANHGRGDWAKTRYPSWAVARRRYKVIHRGIRPRPRRPSASRPAFRWARGSDARSIISASPARDLTLARRRRFPGSGDKATRATPNRAIEAKARARPDPRPPLRGVEGWRGTHGRSGSRETHYENNAALSGS